ncbi:ABC transporter ATP-binding protein [Actinacidiphila paucisporea]|uniref:NitT/TauT family transport system ATP-binding protein n=1 Tax=Actinacidiphila paucisporea TaxID=310782 RepID=A0A1M7G5Q2_9ACTN|nr:ABC transporter ATP-binding protein [Actinacidiphila paucisporea]SHM11418.1 NitT/TauT family transport system ATP-binding protein [Actinacidiphila paucisporea]
MTGTAKRPPTTSAGLPLRVEGLGKTFRSARGAAVRALDGIDLTIGAGEFVSILGPSGCGKSTLLAILAGLDTATDGTASVGGRPVTAPLVDAGVMFQRDLLLDWHTCEDNILMQFRMRGLATAPYRDRARELLALVGMEHAAQRYPRELSGGMRQRVAICRALVHEPPLLFLDEPFGALDALTRENLNTELAALTAHSGATVVFVTHGIDEAVFLGDRAVVMSARPGRVIADVAIDLPVPRGPQVRELPQFTAYTARLRKLLAHEVQAVAVEGARS